MCPSTIATEILGLLVAMRFFSCFTHLLSFEVFPCNLGVEKTRESLGYTTVKTA